MKQRIAESRPIRSPRGVRRTIGKDKRRVALVLTLLSGALAVASCAALNVPTQAAAAAGAVGGAAAPAAGPAASAANPAEGSQLESAAHRAGETGRKVAMSLIALGFAIAAVVLAFRRDFKEAVGVFAIGVVAVLFAQEAGVKLVENLVHTLVG